MSNSRNPTDTLAEIERLFQSRGDGMYAGEPVTQTQHALQCATLAEREHAPPALITAALLHDIGHLLHGHDENCAEQGIDDQHEALGMRWLTPRFAAEVCEPVGMHVMAKRYRCAVDAEYHERLSAASQLSLRLQGGPLSPEAAERFRQQHHFEAAITLRRWDEAAKDPTTETPPLAHFLSYVSASLKAQA